MHILLIEASLSGHHSIYLERTALAYLRAGNKVTIALPSDIENSETLYLNLTQYPEIKWFKYKPQFYLDSIGILGLVEREYTVRKIFGKIYKDVQSGLKVDYVFLPYIDYCLYAIGLMGSPFGRTKFGGICMRPSFHFKALGVIAPNSKFDGVKRFLFKRFLGMKTLSRVFSIDELLANHFNNNLSLESSKIQFLADPVETPDLIESKPMQRPFEIQPDSRVILVYGVLNERKGICLLLDTLQQESVVQNWRVWLVGRQTQSIRDLISGERWAKLKAQHRIISFDEFASKELEQQVLSACDVVWVAYSDHYGMSGVMVHATKHRKPIIAGVEGLVGWHAKRGGLGPVIDGTVQSTAKALALLGNGAYAGKENEDRWNEYFKKNNWMEFEVTMLLALNSQSRHESNT